MINLKWPTGAHPSRFKASSSGFPASTTSAIRESGGRREMSYRPGKCSDETVSKLLEGVPTTEAVLIGVGSRHGRNVPRYTFPYCSKWYPGGTPRRIKVGQAPCEGMPPPLSCAQPITSRRDWQERIFEAAAGSNQGRWGPPVKPPPSGGNVFSRLTHADLSQINTALIFPLPPHVSLHFSSRSTWDRYSSSTCRPRMASRSSSADHLLSAAFWSHTLGDAVCAAMR